MPVTRFKQPGTLLVSWSESNLFFGVWEPQFAAWKPQAGPKRIVLLKNWQGTAANLGGIVYHLYP
jgi:hypothetical protein